MDLVRSITGSLVVIAVVGLIGTIWTRARRRRPLRLDVEPQVRQPWGAVLPGELPDPTALEARSPSSPEVNDWLRSHGAADHRTTTLKVIATSMTSETVRIADMRIVAKCEPAHGHTRVFCPAGGANSASLLLFDLDDSEPVAWEWEDQNGPRVKVGTEPFFARKNVTLTAGEVHEFIIVVKTQQRFCRWHLEVDTITGRRRQALTVRDKGQEFQTVGDPADGFPVRLHWAWYDPPAKFRPEPKLGSQDSTNRHT